MCSSCQSRGASLRALAISSSVSRSRSSSERSRKSGRSALASVSRSSTKRFMRSSSSVMMRRVSGSAPSSSCRWPRMIVIGVRSSWPASETNSRCSAKACSSRSSIALNRWPSSAISSSPVTSIRRVRSSVDPIERAVAPSVRSGASTRPTAAKASADTTRQHGERDPERDLHGVRDLAALVLEVRGDDERALALPLVGDRDRDVAGALDVAALDRVDLPQLTHAVQQLLARAEVGVGAVRRLADERERRLALVRDVAAEELVEQPPRRRSARSARRSCRNSATSCARPASIRSSTRASRICRSASVETDGAEGQQQRDRERRSACAPRT